jgi:hypothetical protein
MDACDMKLFAENSFDLCFDKGTLDALLSHGGDETGTDERIISMMNEVWRVLKPGGKYLIVSGNDTFLVFPYVYQLEWEVSVETIQRGKSARKGSQVDFSNLHTYLYTMTKPL